MKKYNFNIKELIKNLIEFYILERDNLDSKLIKFN